MRTRYITPEQRRQRHMAAVGFARQLLGLKVKRRTILLSLMEQHHIRVREARQACRKAGRK